MATVSENEARAARGPVGPRERCVHTITDRFSLANTYLVEAERLIIVDPGSELNARLTLAYLQRYLHRTPDDIDLIVLTHLHPDHTDGVTYLRRQCRAPVAASAIARQLAEAEQQNLGNWSIPRITHLAGQMLPGILHHLDLFPPNYSAQVKMVDVWLENVAGLPDHTDWRVIASPGHTPESLCLYNPFTLELLCGDTLITMEGGSPLIGGTTNRRQLSETLQTLRSLEIHYLYPGHGRPILSPHPFQDMAVTW